MCGSVWLWLGCLKNFRPAKWSFGVAPSPQPATLPSLWWTMVGVGGLFESRSASATSAWTAASTMSSRCLMASLWGPSPSTTRWHCSSTPPESSSLSPRSCDVQFCNTDAKHNAFVHIRLEPRVVIPGVSNLCAFVLYLKFQSEVNLQLFGYVIMY